MYHTSIDGDDIILPDHSPRRANTLLFETALPPCYSTSGNSIAKRVPSPPFSFSVLKVSSADETVADDLPSDDEMEGINKIVKDTEVMKMIRNQADAHERSLKELHHNIDEQLNTIHEHLK